MCEEYCETPVIRTPWVSFSCPDYRGVLISGVMYFGLKLIDIMNYRCGGCNSAAILDGKQNLSSCESSRVFIVELNLEYLRDMR